MKVWIFAVLVLGLYLVQTSLFSSVSVWGVRPDLVLVLVCVVGLHRGFWDGAVGGFLAGLLLDLAEGHLIGLGAATKAFAGAGAGLIGQTLFGTNALVPVLVVLSASVVEHTSYLLGTWAFGVYRPFAEGLFRVILPSAWLDALSGAILFPLIAPLVRRYVATDKEHGVGSAEG